MEEIEKFINQKASECELYDYTFSQKLDNIYINRHTNKLSLFSLNIKKIFFFLQIVRRENLKKSIKKNAFLIDFIKKTNISSFDYDRLVHLEKIIKKNKPKVIFELGSGVSTVWMSYIINKHNLDCKIFSFEDNKFYLDKLLKNIDFNILKNITFSLKKLKLFKHKDRRFVRYDSLPTLENVDLLYIDGPVMYEYKKFENIKFIKSGDINHILINELPLPKMIVTDKKYDLYPIIKKTKKFKIRFDRLYHSLILNKVND